MLLLYLFLNFDLVPLHLNILHQAYRLQHLNNIVDQTYRLQGIYSSNYFLNGFIYLRNQTRISTGNIQLLAKIFNSYILTTKRESKSVSLRKDVLVILKIWYLKTSR